VEKNLGVSQNLYVVGSLSVYGQIYPDDSGNPGVSGTFTTADTPAKTVTVTKGIITSIV